MNLLEVKNLKTFYFTPKGTVNAVNDVSFNLKKGDVLGLAGESGCGKTTILLSIARLLPDSGKIVGGGINFEGNDLLKMSDEELRQIRWNKISVIFQGAINALNPLLKVGDQIAETMAIHMDMEKSEAWRKAEELLELVGVDPLRTNNYPHELSGGMKQRVMIAMAMACNPSLVLADEPTTALDVIVQSQVIKLLKDLRMKLDMSIIIVSHDLSIFAEICDKIAILYAGKIMEYADAMSIFKNPQHPYTKALIKAFPSVVGPITELQSIHGSPPSLINPPHGCKFHPRCDYKMEICNKREPDIREVEKGHYKLCHLE